MIAHHLDADHLGNDEDWEGSDAAFTCPACAKVFLVSSILHGGRRPCPRCALTVGVCQGGQNSGGIARIEWSSGNDRPALNDLLRAFASGSISAGRAADLAGLTKGEFLDHASASGISPFNIRAETIDDAIRGDLESIGRTKPA